MAESKLPGIQAKFLDNQLRVNPPRQLRNNSILVIGTAEDGPSEPVTLQSLDQAVEVFGRWGLGTLVRGIHEVFGASVGAPDVRGYRLTNGKKAILYLQESAGSGVDAVTSNAVTKASGCMQIEALLPGEIYNLVSIRVDDKDQKITIFNPKTNVESKFSFSADEDNLSVDVHNVSELVSAINADPNLSNIVNATFTNLNFEAELMGANVEASGFVQNSDNTTEIHMKNITGGQQWTYEQHTRSTSILTGEARPAFSVAQSAGNNIRQLNRVYEISHISGEVLDGIAGRAQWELNWTPLNANNVSPFTGSSERLGGKTLTAFEDYDLDGPQGSGWVYFSPGMDSDTTAAYDVLPTAVSEYRQYVRRQFIGFGDGITSGFTWSADVCPDDSRFKTDGRLLQSKWLSESVSGIGNNILASGDGYSAAQISNTKAITPRLYRERASDGVLYEITSGFWWLRWDGRATTDGGPVTGSIGPQATVDVHAVETPADADKLYITYDSVKDTLTETTQLNLLPTTSTNWNAWKTYFVADNTVYLAKPAPTDIEVSYVRVKDYEPGTDVILSDPAEGKIKFTDPNNQPGTKNPDIGGWSAGERIVFGVDYDYLPNFPSLGSAKSLAGGTNGINLSGIDLKKALKSAYEDLVNYAADIVVPMNVHLDDTYTRYNPITGLKETVNAEYHIDFANFLNDVSMNVNETWGIISVNPPLSTSVRDINTWVDRLTRVDVGDPLRAATVYSKFAEKLIDVVCFQPVITAPLGAQIYTSTGEAIYAGMQSSLPPQESATNKAPRGMNGIRFLLSNAQLEALDASRYVTTRRSPVFGVVITNSVTAGAVGSDYTSREVWRIVQAAMDVVREAGDPFIGRPNSLENRNALKTAINRGLQGMTSGGAAVEQGRALRGYEFDVISSPNQQVLGLVEIPMVLVPMFTIKQIKVTVKLRAQ